MVIESGCRPVKVQSEKGLAGGGVERETEDRKRAEQERAEFHSLERHVLLRLTPPSVILLLITGFNVRIYKHQTRQDNKQDNDLDAIW